MDDGTTTVLIASNDATTVARHSLVSAVTIRVSGMQTGS
jgi:hypothetical protein